MTTPTARETADHAELARLAEAAAPYWHAARLACGRNPIAVGLVAPFVGAMSPAVCSALLSEIAALRGERDGFCPDGAELPTWPELAAYWKDRATQAERQRDEAFELLREIKRADIHQEGDDIDNHVAGASHHSRAWIGPVGLKIRAFLANQGADQ